MPCVVAHFLHLALLKQTKRDKFLSGQEFASHLLWSKFYCAFPPRPKTIVSEQSGVKRNGAAETCSLGERLDGSSVWHTTLKVSPGGFLIVARCVTGLESPTPWQATMSSSQSREKAFNLLCSSLLPFERHSLELLRAARSCCILLLKQQKGPHFVIHVFAIWYSLDSRSHLILFCNYCILYFLYRFQCSNSVLYQFWDQ